MWIPLAFSGFGLKKPPPVVRPEWTFHAAPEPIETVIRRMEPADLVLTDAEALAIMDRARVAAAGYEDKSERSYQIATSIFKQKRALKELADLQDEAWRGCVAAFISDSD
jgi:hypothetical protein